MHLELFESPLELFDHLVVQFGLLDQCVSDLRLLLTHERQHLCFHGGHVGHRNIVEVPVGPGVNADHLVGNMQRFVLRLLENLDHAVSAIQLRLCGLVELGAQLGKGFEFTEGGQVQSQ